MGTANAAPADIDDGAALVLGVVAVGPDGIPLGALWGVDALAGIDVAAVIQRLEASGAVEVDGGGVVRVTTGTRADALAGLGAIARARLRGALGRSLRDSAVIAPPVVAELLVEGLLADADPSVLPWIMGKADRLLREGHLAEAVALLETVHGAIDAGHPVPSAVRLRALSRLAYMLRWVGRIADADALVDRTHAAAVASGDAEDLAIAAVTWTPRQLATTDDPSGFALLDDAVARLDEIPVAIRPHVLACRATALAFTDLDDARRTAVDGLARARELDDPESFIFAAYAHRVVHWHPSRQEETLALANEMVARAPHALEYAEYGPLTRLQVFLERGDWEHFDGELAAMGRRLARHPRPFEELWFRAACAVRAIVRGDWEESRGHTDRALEVGAGASYDVAYQLLLTQQVLVAWHQGDDLTPLLEVTLPAGPLNTAWQACLLGFTSTRRPAEDLRQELERFLADGMASVRPDLTFGPVTTMLAVAAVAASSATHAQVLYDGLLPYRDQWAATSGSVVTGPYAFHLGSLATVLGRTDEALELLQDALVACVAGGSRPWEARTRLALAPLVDTSTSREHLDRAGALADELAMSDLAAQVAALAGRAARPAGLSAREVEVLALLARGATNKEIADTLFLSIKTVERHLLNTYRTIGARGRAEATAFALRHDLA